ALAVHPSVPAQNLKEFVAYAKANAGKLSYGHAGVGSLNQLTGEMFKLLAGLPELAQVPYRGAGPVMADLISGQVVMGMVALTSQSLEFHRSGKLRILAVTSPERLIAAPELSTVAEAGFPGLTNQSTIGPVAPAGTPKPIIEQIAHVVRTALAEPAYQQKLIDSGFEASPDTTPEKFRRRLEADVAFWTPVVEALGLKIAAPRRANHAVSGKSHETSLAPGKVQKRRMDDLKPFAAIQRVQHPPGKGEPASRKRALHGWWQHQS